MRSLKRVICVKNVFSSARVCFVLLSVTTFIFWKYNIGVSFYREQTLVDTMPMVQENYNLTFDNLNRSRFISSALLESTDGFDRATRVAQMCNRYKETQCVSGNPKSPYCNIRHGQGKVRVDYNKKRQAMYCPMCKMASTFWTRVFRMLTINDNGSPGGNALLTPYNVPIADAPASSVYFDVTKQVVLPKETVDFKFMFVRDPYSLLFSTYVDKIIGPNPNYWEYFGQEATKRIRGARSQVCGADVTFKEFLDHVVHRFRSGKDLDCHFAKYSTCKPCYVNYDFIGKMENFKVDTLSLLDFFNQSKTINVFKERFGDLHAYDAIEDSVAAPFEWKADIIKCIPWHQALGRIWRKLQIRGVIGTNTFPLSPMDSENISQEEFISVLVSSRKNSNSHDRSTMKRQAYAEAYKGLPNDLIGGVKLVYKEEFDLFDYNTSPLIDI